MTKLHAQVTTLCNVTQEAQDNIAHEKILFNNVVRILGQHCTGRNLCHVAQETPDNIVQEKNPVQCRLNNIIFRRFLFWTGYIFDNNRLLQMSRQHCTSFLKIAQENSQSNIEQKGKIVRNSNFRMIQQILFQQRLSTDIVLLAKTAPSQ